MTEVGTHLARWMLFVDGENLTIRAQKLAARERVTLIPGPYYLEDTFVWVPGIEARTQPPGATWYNLQRNAIRAYYYTSVVGDEDKVFAVQDYLWKLNFQPSVFKKKKQAEKAKGVDIALTTDLLSGAYTNNFDHAILVAGDGDYVPLVTEVKRLGKVVHILFFDKEGDGLSPALRLASDNVLPGFDSMFVGQWRQRNTSERRMP